MAGSFGFEAEHYALSMRIGEDRLFPAVRAEPADTLIAATGVSCRQQIEHGTGRRAHHPVELVYAASRHRSEEYERAFRAWERSEDAQLWDRTTSDGL
jgi:hypothetical protein